MADVPDDAPSSCPGTQSESAGRASACETCPNRSLCSTGQAKLPLEEREPDVIAAIQKRLDPIPYKIMILSGKGGVGKTSLTVCLARGLSRLEHQSNKSMTNGDQKSVYRVGVLDLDLCGPSTPCLFGCMDAKVHQSQSGWSPVFISDSLSLMSIGFLLPNPDQAIIWRGPRKNTLIKQFLTSVAWSDQDYYDSTHPGHDQHNLDFLLIDTPPGTSDEHLSAIQYLMAAKCLTGALIITTPQEMALSDVRKEINFCHKLGLPILGVVENMTEFICPSCHYRDPIFPPSTGGAASLVDSTESNNPNDKGFDLLGRLPLDPRLTRILDEGLCPFELAESSRDELMKADDHDIDTNGDYYLKPDDEIMVAYKNLINHLLEKLDCPDRI